MWYNYYTNKDYKQLSIKNTLIMIGENEKQKPAIRYEVNDIYSIYI